METLTLTDTLPSLTAKRDASFKDDGLYCATCGKLGSTRTDIGSWRIPADWARVRNHGDAPLIGNYTSYWYCLCATCARAEGGR